MSAIDSIEKLDGEVFKQINGFDNYYISNKGRCYNTKTHRFVGSDNGQGYKQVHLSQNHKLQHPLIHQLVMEYFGPPKPKGKIEIDHKHQTRNDNRIDNLRWVSPSKNQQNRTSYNGVDAEYIEYDDLSDDLITVNHYGEHEFNDVYYSVDQNKFYFDTGINYRILNVNMASKGYAFVYARNTANKQIKICFNKFKREYGIDSF